MITVNSSIQNLFRCHDDYDKLMRGLRIKGLKDQIDGVLGNFSFVNFFFINEPTTVKFATSEQV